MQPFRSHVRPLLHTTIPPTHPPTHQPPSPRPPTSLDHRLQSERFTLPSGQEVEAEARAPPDLEVVRRRLKETVAVLDNFSSQRQQGRSRAEYLDQVGHRRRGQVAQGACSRGPGRSREQAFRQSAAGAEAAAMGMRRPGCCASCGARVALRIHVLVA